jgi:hypothetical protein
VDAFDDSNAHAQAIREATEESRLSIGEVWMRYFSFTGAAGEYELDACLHGSLDPTGAGRTRWAVRWKPALNAFAITFSDRFPAAESY